MSTTQQNFDNALLVNAYTNAGLGILFLLCFEVIRKRLPRIYEPRVSEGYHLCICKLNLIVVLILQRYHLVGLQLPSSIQMKCYLSLTDLMPLCSFQLF